MQVKISIDSNAMLPTRFFSYAKLGLYKFIQDHEKNQVEKLADVGLYAVEEFPKKIIKMLRDPRIVTIALTAFAMIATSFTFYPKHTTIHVKAAIALFPEIPYWAAKFTVYVATMTTIFLYSLRAQGRFWNEALMSNAEEPVESAEKTS